MIDILPIFRRQNSLMRKICACMRTLQRALAFKDMDESAHITAQISTMQQQLDKIEDERFCAANNFLMSHGIPVGPDGAGLATVVKLLSRKDAAELSSIIDDIRQHIHTMQILKASISKFSSTMFNTFQNAQEILTNSNARMYQVDGTQIDAKTKAVLCDHKR